MNANDPSTSIPDALAEDALRWVVRLHSGTAGKAERQAYEAWRAENALHERAALEAEALWADMSDLHIDRRNGLIAPGRPATGLSRRGLLGGALCLGALSATGGVLWSNGTMRRLTADYATDTAGARTVTLPDGSKVILNARSAIDIAFTTERRRIFLLDGQAYFEVAPDAARPFEVEIGHVSVTALGTAFDIARDLPGKGTEVAVTEHAVRVKAISSRSGVYGQTIDVSEGESVVIDQAGAFGTVLKQSRDGMAAWRDGVYVAEARPLREVVHALSAWYPGVILISDRALEALEVNAVLDLTNPGRSLDALAGGLPIRVRRVSNYLTIISMR
nr:FecR domain-containing protein [uncultured Shinella sp.]